MHRRSVSFAFLIAVVAAWTTLAQSAIAVEPCVDGRESAVYANREKFNHGVRSVQEIEAASVPNGIAVAHPNDDSAFNVAVGGEVRGPDENPPQMHIDTHFDALAYYRGDYNYWYSWNSTNSYRCDDFGYQVREIAPDNVWVEEKV